MKEKTTLMQVDNLHSELNSIIGGFFGSDWTYQIHPFQNNAVLLSFAIRNKTGLLTMNVDFIGDTVIDALENASFLLAKAKEHRHAAEPKSQQVAMPTPTEQDLRDMDDYFIRNSAIYISHFANQMGQGYTKPYNQLTHEQRVRLCILWKNYLKNKSNE